MRHVQNKAMTSNALNESWSFRRWQVGWQDPGADGDCGWLHSNTRAWHWQAIPVGCGGCVLHLRSRYRVHWPSWAGYREEGWRGGDFGPWQEAPEVRDHRHSNVQHWPPRGSSWLHRRCAVPWYWEGCRVPWSGDLRTRCHADSHQVQGQHLLCKEGWGWPKQPSDAWIHACFLLPHLRCDRQDWRHDQLWRWRGADGHARRWRHLWVRAHCIHTHWEGNALRHARGLE